MKKTARKSRLAKVYGITEVQFKTMFQQQNGLCKICSKDMGKKANIDHCHQTGKIRGLLCWNCNIGLGYLKDSLSSFEKAAVYLGRDASYEKFCMWFYSYLEGPGPYFQHVIKEKLQLALGKEI